MLRKLKPFMIYLGRRNERGITMTVTTYPLVWDLDTFFPGGSDSPQLASHLEQVEAKIEAFESQLTSLETPQSASESKAMRDIIEQLKDVATNLSEAGATIGCFLAQDTTDKKAALLQGQVSSLGARLGTILMTIQQKWSKTDESVWAELIASEELNEFEFILNEWREKAAKKLSQEEEALITSLGVDGYQGWGQLYDLLIADM